MWRLALKIVTPASVNAPSPLPVLAEMLKEPSQDEVTSRSRGGGADSFLQLLVEKQRNVDANLIDSTA